MNSIRKHAFRKSIYLLALGLSLIPGSVAAQTTPSKMDGKFALTSEARCGSELLLPGSYTFSLETDGPFAVIRISKSNHVVAAFISQTQVRKVTPSQDILKLVRAGGGPYVQSLDLPDRGIEFKFPVPKSATMSTEVSALP
jgi:hypothetical protein